MENTYVKDLVRVTGGTLLAGDEELQVKNISIDSRVMKGEDLFVPLIGERSDAHDYLDSAIKNGAICVLCSRDMEPLPGAAWIKVENTLKALQAIGKAYRIRMGLPVIGVTGSVGKTTTREMVATALGAKFRVFRTSKNFNSDIGLPVTMTEISSEDRIAVLEMGMSDFGEMEVLSSLALPDAAVMTNIGVAHIEQLKTRENIFLEKIKIASSMREGGTLILNGDDDYLGDRSRTEGRKRIFYGFGPENDYRAENVTPAGEGVEFTAICKDKRVKVWLPVYGNHQVMNALAAMAAASLWDISMEDAAEALAHFAGFQRRQQIISLGELTGIDDTYNASPDSMKAALGVLAQRPCEGRKIAVLANMLELGERTKEFHYGVGEYASALAPDILLTVGDLGREIARGLSENGDGKTEICSFDSNPEAAAFLLEHKKAGDLILFKGSNGMHLGEIIEALKKQGE